MNVSTTKMGKRYDSTGAECSLERVPRFNDFGPSRAGDLNRIVLVLTWHQDGHRYFAGLANLMYVTHYLFKC